jgi:hypothetical protein
MSLLQYIEGRRKGKEAHRLEREAMQDPFLADALDGYDKVKGNHRQRITGLHRQIAQKSRTGHHRYFRYWSIAAGILLLIGIGTFRLFYQPSQLSQLSQPSPSQPSQSSLFSPPSLPEPPASEKPVSPPLLAENKTTVHFTPPVVAKDETIGYEASEQASEQEAAPVAAVRGKIVDETGEPLIGASVVFAGADQGTVTDIEGNFVLTGDEDEINIQYIGYETINLPVDTGRSMLIAMNESRQTLDEVVVVGYGKSKKASVTGSISKIAVKEKEDDFDDYVKRELIHPTDEECKEVKGNVMLRFSIDEKGRPYNITVRKSLCPSADREAIRLVEHSPDWPLTDKEITKKIHF